MTTRKSQKSTTHDISTANDTELPFRPSIPAPELRELTDVSSHRAKKATLADVKSDYAAPKKPSPTGMRKSKEIRFHACPTEHPVDRPRVRLSLSRI
jgi:hypothetical protein